MTIQHAVFGVLLPWFYINESARKRNQMLVQSHSFAYTQIQLLFAFVLGLQFEYSTNFIIALLERSVNSSLHWNHQHYIGCNEPMAKHGENALRTGDNARERGGAEKWRAYLASRTLVHFSALLAIPRESRIYLRTVEYSSVVFPPTMACCNGSTHAKSFRKTKSILELVSYLSQMQPIIDWVRPYNIIVISLEAAASSVYANSPSLPHLPTHTHTRFRRTAAIWYANWIRWATTAHGGYAS